MGAIQAFGGPIDARELGVTLIHEHIFVRNPELESNLPDPEWDRAGAVDAAVRGLAELHELGVRTVVDLTVPGLGRDVELVAEVAARTPIRLVASTGWYTSNALPVYFAFHGPGRPVGGPEPLVELFVRDIQHGIAGTSVRAGMLKVMTDVEGITSDVGRVMTAAATAHLETGVPITTHSHPSTRNGLRQQAFLEERGVPLDRVIIGHSGDSEDLDYLRELMDNGSTIGMDRFGMEHILPDDRRVHTVLRLLEAGYGDRMVLSHDAAFYSHVTPPSWRARFAPRWRMDTIPRHILPALRAAGASETDLELMLVRNPRRLLEVA
ncbi:MAG TPA: phosphotriesterase-related protein [Candidatus Angelobacter sp.]|nr:phosphotriesterase-related protein [Candidatus Angelobacter sp.]